MPECAYLCCFVQPEESTTPPPSAMMSGHPIPRSVRTPRTALSQARWAARAQFLNLGVVAGVWGVHVPSLKSHYALDERALAGALLAMSLGSVLTLDDRGSHGGGARRSNNVSPRRLEFLSRTRPHTGPAGVLGAAAGDAAARRRRKRVRRRDQRRGHDTRDALRSRRHERISRDVQPRRDGRRGSGRG